MNFRIRPGSRATLGAVLCSLLLRAPDTAATETRKLPDYAGREKKATAGDVAIWIPRVLFSPLYLVSEYVIRRPLGAVVTVAERKHVPETLVDVFTWTEDHRMGLVPTLFLDFGFKPSVGFYFFWDDFLARGNDLRLKTGFWGTSWLAASLTDRIRLGETQMLTFQLLGVRRPDYRYYGEGPAAPDEALSRYGADRFQAAFSFGSELFNHLHVDTGAGARRLTFHEPASGYTSTEERIAAGTFAEPEAFDTGYSAAFTHVHARLDSRLPRARTGSGVRLEAGAEQGAGLDSTPRSWLRWGGALTGYLDLNERGRIVSLTLASLFSDPLNDRAQPFTELVQLGGKGPMPGYLPGRLFGRSAAVATLSYRWPIWVFLNGQIQAAVGNVFGDHLRDFSASQLRFSSAIGVETAQVTDNPVQILFGVGTETFDSGARVDSFRFVAGTTSDF